MTAGDNRSDLRHESNPYVGPRPFRQAEATRFFGRDAEAQHVMNSWINERVTILHGPAAIGKTSLLRAGVLPVLAQQPKIDLLPVGGLGCEVSRPPVIPAAYNGYTFTLLSRWARFGEPLAPGMSISDFLLARSAVLPESSEPPSLLVAIDHFEELFTAFPARQSEREEFVDQIAAALRDIPTLKLLIVINDEHLTKLDSPFLPHYIRLDALTSEEALSAITRPLAGTGLAFSAGVAEELVERLSTVDYTNVAGDSVSLRHDEIQPLFLQIICTDIWSSLEPDAELINTDLLRSFGDVNRALARYYDSAIRTVQLGTRETEERLRSWIESSFITEHGTRGTAYRGLLTTAGMPNRVADAFAEAHIITAEYRARSTWYQLSHDRMIAPTQEANRAWRASRGLDITPPTSSVTPEALISAAEMALAAGNFPSAQRYAAGVIEQYRDSGDTRRLGYALTSRASIARAEGDFRTAERYLQDALSEFTVLQDQELIARTLSALADVSFADGDYGKAKELQREAVDRLPSYVDAMIGLGYAEWYFGSPADAEATFALALGRSAGAGRASGGRGQVLAELAEYDTALANLNPALDSVLPPEEEVDARSARALALTGLGRDEEADRELAAARRQAPDRGRTHRRAGRIAAMRKQNALAIAEFKQALDAEPPLPPWDESNARRFLTQLQGTKS